MKGRDPKGEGGRLLILARQAIESVFTKRNVELDAYADLTTKEGAFVTLTKEGELRGCIGLIQSDLPLCKTIVEAAKAAAFEDPRFPRLEPEELGSIRIEISILTRPETITVKSPDEYLKRIKPGRDGLIIRQGFHTGLLLPQVASEYGWNAETFLEHLCRKAGLPIKAWKEPGTRIESFQARIYTEE